jgi:hypothetical protein
MFSLHSALCHFSFFLLYIFIATFLLMARNSFIISIFNCIFCLRIAIFYVLPCSFFPIKFNLFRCQFYYSFRCLTLFAYNTYKFWIQIFGFTAENHQKLLKQSDYDNNFNNIIILFYY